jgi:hypothetical protein
LALTVRMCTRTIAAIAAITTPSARTKRPFLPVRDVSSSSSISAPGNHYAEKHIAEYSVLMVWRKASTQPEESLSENRLGFGLVQSYGRLPVGERFQVLEGDRRSDLELRWKPNLVRFSMRFRKIRVKAPCRGLTARSSRQGSGALPFQFDCGTGVATSRVPWLKPS